MSREISLYPVLNKRLIETIKYQRSLISFFYTGKSGDKERISITDSLNSPEITLNDERNQWSIDKDNLIVDFTIMFEDLKPLFGEKGIVSKGGKLGFGIEWLSRESMIRGSKKFHSIGFEDELDFIYIDGTLTLDSKILRESLDVELFLYLETESKDLSYNEQHLVNQKGSKLGVFDKFRLILEGHGTDFPLTEYMQPKDPLWKIMSTWNDPFIDSFNDNISIFINRGHKNYRFLDASDAKNFNPLLMDEIILSSLHVIIWKTINHDTWQYRNDYIVSNGSIAAAVLHFIDTFNLDTETEESLSNSLRAINMELAQEVL